MNNDAQPYTPSQNILAHHCLRTPIHNMKERKENERGIPKTIPCFHLNNKQ